MAGVMLTADPMWLHTLILCCYLCDRLTGPACISFRNSYNKCGVQLRHKVLQESENGASCQKRDRDSASLRQQCLVCCRRYLTGS